MHTIFYDFIRYNKVMKIVRYTQEMASPWDEHVKASRNGTFLFLRAYMDYHSDRFTDHSLLFYSDKGRLLAVLPANEKGDTLYSHQGLTYGGFILAPKVHTVELGEMFSTTITYLRDHGFSKWYYKQMPTVYHKMPSEDDDYWLWRNHAELDDFSLMNVVNLQSKMNIASSRKTTYHNKLLRMGYTVEMDAPMKVFWPILEENLRERFASKPVHTLSEITLLKSRFPENILCCVAKNPDGVVVAGTVLFVTDQVVKTQYISASPEGKRTNALDMLMVSLIKHYRNLGFRYFDFGTSMHTDSTVLNDGLVLQKENFGGRGVALKIWKLGNRE